MPKTAKNYSIVELEMCSLALNITSFTHLLKRVDFDAVVNHLPITHIMKRKNGTSYQQNKETVRNLKFLFVQSVLYQGKRHDPK